MNKAANVSMQVLPRAMALCSVLFACWAGSNAGAQTNTAKTAKPSNRYLLIVETSRSMERRAEGVQQTVRDIFGLTLSKELRKEDSIGVWTFNDKLNAGRFPVQHWSPGANGALAAVTSFLAQEKYEKKPQLDKVLPALAGVVANSPVLTVILISSGTEEIHGTPFDEPVNATFKKWRDQQQSKRMPFVTFFRAAKGKMTGYAVAPAPWPLDIPKLPEPPKPVVAQTKPAAPEKKAVVPPLIVSGKKPQPVQTNLPPASTTSKVDSPATTNAAAPTLGEAPRANIQSAVVPGNVEASLVNTSGIGAEIPPPPRPTGQAAGSNSTGSATTAIQAMKEPALVPAAVISDSKATVETVAPPPDKPSESKPENASVNPPQPDTSSSSVAASSATAPAQVASVPPPRSPLVMGLLLGAAGCLVFAVGVFWWAKTRSRAHRPISLITRSLDRQN